MCGESGVVVNAAFLFLAFVCPLCGLKRDNHKCTKEQPGNILILLNNIFVYSWQLVFNYFRGYNDQHNIFSKPYVFVQIRA